MILPSDEHSARVLCHLPFDHREFEIQGNVDDRGVIGIIERLHHYEPDVMLALQSLLVPDAICVDGGANIGVLSIAMALYAPKGQVYAFEPGAENIAYLEQNLRHNAVGNVDVIPTGLWSGSETKTLHFAASHAGSAYISDRDDAYSAAEKIQVIALDRWVEERGLDRLDLLKLDIEGAEPWALAGAKETIRLLSPILLMEFNPTALQRFQSYDYWELYETLRRLFPVITYVREDGSQVRIRTRGHLARLLARKGVLDLICLPIEYPSRTQRLREQIRTEKERVRLLWAYNRLRPSPQAFLYEPSYDARFMVNPVRMHAGQTIEVPIHLRNTGRTWLSSSWVLHPVMASYHWLDQKGQVMLRDGRRTPLPAPLRPGGSATVPLQVAAPGEPGPYILAFSLVQERFGWCDQIRPDLSVRMPVIVEDLA